MAQENTITKTDIEHIIVDEMYYWFPGTTMTVCCLKLQNGFTVIGQAACVDPENFNERMGRELAYDDAFNKIWQLEGYALSNRLYT